MFSDFRHCHATKTTKSKLPNKRNKWLLPKVKYKIRQSNVNETAANVSDKDLPHNANKQDIMVKSAAYSEKYCPLKNMPAVKDNSKHKLKKVNIGFLVII